MLAVCMAVYDSDNKLLLTRRSKKMKLFPRAWVLPGGHIEKGESLEDGVIREIEEETGVKIEQVIDGSSTFYMNNGK